MHDRFAGFPVRASLRSWLLTVALLAGATAAAGSPGTAAGAGPTCYNTIGYYWAKAWSGVGDTIGTGAYTTTWSNWWVPNDKGFSDEAVWILDYDNFDDSIEVGFYTGASKTLP
ncbi:MAG TPA: hypothetical protein VFB34_08990 [Chloroflexota bacterium]|nr:hypothetical protein [Chloroflexota bacterium]